MSGLGRVYVLPLDALKRIVDDVKSGVKIDGWRITWGNLRYAFISRELLMHILVELMRFLGDSFKESVFKFTTLSCFAEASCMIDMGTPPEEVVEKCAEFVSASGWGIVKVVEVNLRKPRVKVRIYNPSVASWFKSNVKDLEKTFPFYECAWWGYSWIGVVKAALEAMGVEPPPLVYRETKCYAKGRRYCEFVIEEEGEVKPGEVKPIDICIPRELLNYRNVKGIVGEGFAYGNPEETVGLFLKVLEAREDGSIGIIEGDSVLMAPSILFSLAYWLIPIEMFKGKIHMAYKKACNEYGRRLAKRGEEYGAEGVLSFFLSSASSMGWGGIEITDYTNSNVTFNIYQSLYGEDGGAYIKLKRLKPRQVCTPIGYIAEGIINHFAEKKDGKFNAKEEKCIAKGDKHCEFTIEK